jgi:glutaredoxin 3
MQFIIACSLLWVANAFRLVMNSEQLGRVTMYHKKTCPFCLKSTELLEGKYNVIVNYVDVESETNRDEIIYQMKTFSGGRNTVPQIFFNSDHIGGNDDLQKLEESGALPDKIEYVKKTAVSMMMDNWYHPWY